MAKDHKKGIFLLLLLALGYVFYRMIHPYITYVLLGLVLIVALSPLYRKIEDRLKHKKISSLLTIIIVLLIVIIPAFLIGASLIRETTSFFSTINASDIKELLDYAAGLFGFTLEVNINEMISPMISNIGSFMINKGISVMSSFASVVFGLFILISLLYYGFMEGEKWIANLEAFMPFDDSRKERLITEIKKVTKSVINGEILISLIQGVLGGLCFYFAGIPNPVFWGFVMSVLAFLPFVGTGCVWVPAALIEMMNGNAGSSIFIAIYGIIVITGIDYVIRPKIISAGSEIHPLIALIGAFGGMEIFGFIGLVLGPLLAVIFMTIVSFYKEDYFSKKSHGKGIRKRSSA